MRSTTMQKRRTWRWVTREDYVHTYVIIWPGLRKPYKNAFGEWKQKSRTAPVRACAREFTRLTGNVLNRDTAYKYDFAITQLEPKPRR
jgi:hypothetical protein